MSEKYTKVIKIDSKNKCNCVKWAREKVPSLPFGLWTIKDKIKIINSHKPKVGSVAIMNVGLPWGHVGIVKKVGKNHITIREANFKICKITERHGNPEEIKILGYFQP